MVLRPIVMLVIEDAASRMAVRGPFGAAGSVWATTVEVTLGDQNKTLRGWSGFDRQFPEWRPWRKGPMVIDLFVQIRIHSPGFDETDPRFTGRGICQESWDMRDAEARIVKTVDQIGEVDRARLLSDLQVHFVVEESDAN